MARPPALRWLGGAGNVIALLPLAVVGPTGEPAFWPARATPLMWGFAAVWTAIAVLDLLAGGRVSHGWPVLSEAAARAWLGLSAGLPLYQDPELFVPAQLWSAGLVHAGWFGQPGTWFFTLWQLLLNLAVMLTAGRALERAVGSVGIAALLLLLLMPLVGAIHLRAPGSLVLGTASALAVAVAATAWGFFAAHRLRIALVYWLVVAVGAVPVHLHLRWLALAFAALELSRLGLGRVGDGREQAIGVLTALLLGFACGSAARLLARSR